MKLLGPNTPKWVVNNRYGIGSLICIGILTVGYFFAIVLDERNRKLAAECGFDCPNFIYYHIGGDATFILFGLAPLWLGVIIAAAVFATLHITR